VEVWKIMYLSEKKLSGSTRGGPSLCSQMTVGVLGDVIILVAREGRKGTGGKDGATVSEVTRH